MIEEKELCEELFSDLITGKRHRFILDGKEFFFYPLTLAMTFCVSRAIKALRLNDKILKLNPYFEIMRLAETKKRECCMLLSLYTTPNSVSCFFDKKEQQRRACFYEEKLSKEATAMLTMYALTIDRTETLIKYFEIDKEQEKVRKIMEVKAKHGSNNITYGGKSLFGTFLTQLKNLGYTDKEILYERPYSYLRMMLVDKVDSIYISDEEMQDLPKEYGGKLLIADNIDNTADIEKMLKEKGLTIN